MSIKQAIEALEAALSDDQPYIEKSRAALAALRSMPAEPVANSRPLNEYLAERIATMTPEQLAAFEAARVRIKAAIATPHTEAVRMSEAEIDAIWDAHADAPTMSFRYLVTEAIEQATAARLGVKWGDV